MPKKTRVDIFAPRNEWMRDVEGLSKLVTEAARAAIRTSGRVQHECELSVILTDDRELRMLNKEHRGIDAPTNVLAFPGEPLEDDEGSYTAMDRPLVMGDILTAYETMVREAAEAGKPLREHLAHIVVHGALHLCGFDHEEESDAEKMEALERRIMKDLGFRERPAEAASPQTSEDAADSPRNKASSPAAARARK